MNHTQFLIYALMKLFVKEINRGSTEEDAILSSYHMKTVIFGGNSTEHQCYLVSTIFFVKFLNLLQTSLKWVYEGVCPNFFIPDNNIFLNKLHVAAQRKLFARLFSLYEMGKTFPLQCPFINSHFHMDYIIT